MHDKTGEIAGMGIVGEDDDIMLISINGIIIRINIDEISILGRATQGVTLMRMNDGNSVVSIARIPKEPDDEDGDDDDETYIDGEIEDGEISESEDTVVPEDGETKNTEDVEKE